MRQTKFTYLEVLGTLTKKGAIAMLLLLFISVYSFAQCPTGTPVSITGAIPMAVTCPTNGTITVSASGTGAPFQYSTISGPLIKPTQAGNVLAGLPAGTYTVRVTDICGNAATLSNVIVADNYVDMVIQSIGARKPTCFGGNDAWLSLNVTGGRPALEYSLSGAATRPYQDSSKFIGLSPGTYSLSVRDQCGEIRTYGYILTDTFDYVPNPAYTNRPFVLQSPFYLENPVWYKCDSVRAQLRMGFLPSTDGNTIQKIFRIYDDITNTLLFTETTTSMTTTQYAQMAVGGRYRIEVEICNKTWTKIYKPERQEYTISAAANTCATQMNLTVETRIRTLTDGYNCPDVNVSVTSGPLGPTYPLTQSTTTQGLVNFNNLPWGSYTIHIVSCCRVKDTVVTFGTPPPPEIYLSQIWDNPNCIDSTASVGIGIRNALVGTGTHTLTFTSGPTTFTSATGGTGTITYPMTYTASTGGGFNINNLPKGTYNLSYIDG